MLFGLIFLVPLLGAALGAAGGAVAGLLTDVGIDDNFIRKVREKVTPGTSALFVMSSDAVIDRIGEAFSDVRADLIFTNVSEEQEERIRAAFGDEEDQGQ